MITPFLVGALLVSGSVAEPGPRVMAALGDSISTGFNACGWYVSCLSRSWATGTDRDLDSHYLRLGMSGGNRNFAEPGATSADLRGQVDRAVTAGAGYVTILIGAQDVCTRTERAMTSVPVYRSRVEQALSALREGLPQARVFVASIPDLRRLWVAGREHGLARAFWTLGRICQSMLADPASKARADVDRRARVRQRVVDFNAVLARACAAYGPRCRTDGGAVFSYPYTLAHISGWDYFHPNALGQKVLAEQTFKHGFDWLEAR
ncbi:SGNH/GDSL hydrolase family protein [Nonomuraea longicatena]|uniref:SGNH/GDSL hydrolase family protein n=1 Tax=Nonomuraea longicatena TaxID=83682 RepID=UPI0031DBE92D